MIPGIDPRVDIAFKKIFGTPAWSSLTMSLIDAVLRPAHGHHVVHLDLLNPYSEKDSLDDKLTILDIKARDERGRLFNVEMQMNLGHWLPPRLLYYWARFYAAHLGRFVGRDPIGYESDDTHLYGYVLCNPLISTDPEGLSAVVCVLPIAGGVATCDGPFPIADVVAVGIIGIAWGIDVWRGPCEICLPCVPTIVGGLGYRGPEDHAHWPLLKGNTHYHIYEMHQSPYPICRCFWVKFPIPGSPPPGNIAIPLPPPDSIWMTPAGGGGPI